MPNCQECVVTNALLVLTFDGMPYVFQGLMAEEGAGISFTEVEDKKDYKIRANGDILSAGSNVRSTEVTVRMVCDEASVLPLWKIWTSNNLDIRNALTCGEGSFSDNCCTDEVWKRVKLLSIKRPDVGDTVEYFEFKFIGVY